MLNSNLLLRLERRTDHGIFLHIPGGKHEPADNHTWDTAWREAHHESQVSGDDEDNNPKESIFDKMGYQKSNTSPSNVVNVEKSYRDGSKRPFSVFIIECTSKSTTPFVGISNKRFTQYTDEVQRKYKNNESVESVGIFRYEDSQGQYSVSLYPFPQYPISHSVQKDNFDRDDIYNLPFIYDYLTHRGHTVHPFPSPGIFSVKHDITKVRPDQVHNYKVKKLSSLGDHSLFTPKRDHIYGFHWVKLNDLRGRWNKDGKVNYHKNQPIWDKYHELCYNAHTCKLPEKERDYLLSEYVHDSIDESFPNGRLFIATTESGFEFPLSSLVINCLTCKGGVFDHFKGVGVSSDAQDDSNLDNER